MWIVALALRRPYTFVVLALLLLISADRDLPDAHRHFSEHQYFQWSAFCGTTPV